MDPMRGPKESQLGHKASLKLIEEIVERNGLDRRGLDSMSPHVSHAQANKAGAIRN